MNQDQYSYVLATKTTLAAGAGVITIQQPSSASRNVHFHGLHISSPDADCEFTVERNGAAASATTATPVGEPSTVPAAKATAWTGSNAGAGTVIGSYKVPAGGSLGVDLSNEWLFGDGTTKNLSIRITSMSGDIFTNITWGENTP